ncbi:hypothetical protein BKA66DRAFT_606097 [Pyrenochaeta sp. MPI-SDFR-AT-0127]|nr:hypothetical protein BKA66DRAFT_606097 [Pyrenochaeta sp. MPI-SDFR-AT-0127]
MRASTFAIASCLFAASAIAVPIPGDKCDLVADATNGAKTTDGTFDTACFKLKRGDPEEEIAVCPTSVDGSVDPDIMDTACFKVKRRDVPPEKIEACEVATAGSASILDTACFKRHVKV